MSKRIGVFAAAFILLALMVCGITQTVYAGEKIAYVEVGLLFDNYEKTKEADKELADMANERQKERDNLVEEIRRLKDEMVVLAEGGEEKKEKQSEIDTKIKELQLFDERIRADLRKIRNDKVKDIFDDLNAEIETYGKKKGYDLIYNGRVLLYKEKKFDITDAILDELNKAYKKK